MPPRAPSDPDSDFNSNYCRWQVAGTSKSNTQRTKPAAALINTAALGAGSWELGAGTRARDARYAIYPPDPAGISIQGPGGGRPAPCLLLLLLLLLPGVYLLIANRPSAPPPAGRDPPPLPTANKRSSGLGLRADWGLVGGVRAVCFFVCLLSARQVSVKKLEGMTCKLTTRVGYAERPSRIL
jgi:hypothetical protein